MNLSRLRIHLLVVGAAVGLVAIGGMGGSGSLPATHQHLGSTELVAAPVLPPKVRTYYIAADEVLWDYAPQDRNVVKDQPFDADESVFVGNGPSRIGDTYRKAVYRAYTDATFSTLAPVPPSEQYLGLLGPVIRATVGDTIRVVFRNNTSIPASVHPHGVFYTKDAEGAPYSDGTSGADKADDAVPPGGTHVYRWEVPDRAGPGPMDGSSVLWMYHSHTDEIGDTNAGLVGPMVITGRGEAKADGSPADVDQEVFSYFSVIDENSSPYLDRNLAELSGIPHTVSTADEEGFEESNLMHSINGYVYGNGSIPVVRKGTRVRWYLFSLGTEVDLHTPHWHGNTATVAGMRTDMAELLPGSMMIADLQPDAVGTWLFHCHVNDHIAAGMITRYRVTP